MKKVLIYLDDEQGQQLMGLAKREKRSVKAMTEKIVLDDLSKRDDGYTDSDYVRLAESRRK